MIELLSNISLVASSSSAGDAESLAALAIALPFMFIWIFWMLLILFFWGFMIVFTVGGSILWILMLIDLVKRDFKKKDEKIIWVLLLTLTGVVGAIVYYFVVKKSGKY